jgi:hypothetical protein
MTHPMLEKFHDTPLDGLHFCRLVYDSFEEVRQEPGGGRQAAKTSTSRKASVGGTPSYLQVYPDLLRAGSIHVRAVG